MLFETIELLGNGGEPATSYANAITAETASAGLDNLMLMVSCVGKFDPMALKKKIVNAKPAPPPALAAAAAQAASYAVEDY